MVEGILKAIGKTRTPISLPRTLMLGLSFPLAGVERILGIKLPINRVRIRKLIRSNNIWPEELRTLGYEYSYSLESAFRDWKADLPEDFA